MFHMYSQMSATPTSNECRVPNTDADTVLQRMKDKLLNFFITFIYWGGDTCAPVLVWLSEGLELGSLGLAVNSHD